MKLLSRQKLGFFDGETWDIRVSNGEVAAFSSKEDKSGMGRLLYYLGAKVGSSPGSSSVYQEEYDDQNNAKAVYKVGVAVDSEGVVFSGVKKDLIRSRDLRKTILSGDTIRPGDVPPPTQPGFMGSVKDALFFPKLNHRPLARPGVSTGTSRDNPSPRKTQNSGMDHSSP